MKKLRLMLAALVVALATAANADTYTYLKVNDSNSNTYEIADISKITFDETYMNIALTGGEVVQLPLASLTTMELTNTSGIILPSSKEQVELTGDGTLRINAQAGARIFLYNIKGQLEKTISTTADQTDIDLRSLPRGVYVVRVNSTSKKIVNQ